jgi:hypothetical protein
MWVVSADEVWVVTPLTHITAQRSDVVFDEPETSFEAVWASGPRDAWAVGTERDVTRSAPGTAPWIGRAIAVHWDGTTAARVPVDGARALHAVAGNGDGEVWAVGEPNAIVRLR